MTTSPVMSITEELVAELEALASKATPGPWVVDFEGSSLYICEKEDDDKAIAVVLPYDKESEDGKWVPGSQTDSNYHYLAAANPATILALLSERAELLRDARRLAFVVSEGITISSMNGTGMPMVYQCQWHDCRQIDWYPSANAAIDTAMQSEAAK